ncbi:uncharacterized protein LOC124168939 [Ischnura elegans]|uniref:uncharacterized protein LOC124168939 n=1 Tax=Ischnura elegans TaxID=197161 RepID=UPI001ED89DB6|nr:uncharacterized protein LOC124168939 [Ischnura elegans]
MAGKKFYVSPETFTDFLLGRDVSARSIDMKGAAHPIFKEAAGVFLGADDDDSCRAVHAYWVSRGQDIVRILKYDTNIERKKEARLRYFLEMMGLKLVKRSEILSGSACSTKDSGVTEVVSQEKVEDSHDSRRNKNVSSGKCDFTVSSSQCTSGALPEVVAMEVEVPVCEIERMAEYGDDSINDSNHSEGEREQESHSVNPVEKKEEDYTWKKEGDFFLSYTEWRGIFQKELKLSRKWTALISKKFSTINGSCVIQFQGYHFNKQRRKEIPFLMMRGYCAHVSCKRFRVAMSSPPTEKENACLGVWSQGVERHDEGKRWRPLTALDRLNEKKAQARELARRIQLEKMKEAGQTNYEL